MTESLFRKKRRETLIVTKEVEESVTNTLPRTIPLSLLYYTTSVVQRRPSKVISLRLSSELLDLLDQVAQRTGYARSTLIAMSIVLLLHSLGVMPMPDDPQLLLTELRDDISDLAQRALNSVGLQPRVVRVEKRDKRGLVWRVYTEAGTYVLNLKQGALIDLRTRKWTPIPREVLERGQVRGQEV